MNDKKSLPQRWVWGALGALLALVVTSVPAQAVPEPSPSPSPASTQEPSSTTAVPSDDAVAPAAGAATDPGSEAASDPAPDGALVIDGNATPAENPTISVPSQALAAPVDVVSEASAGAFGQAEVIAPTPSDEQAKVGPVSALDEAIAARAAQDIAPADSVFVGAAVAPLRDLTGALLGHDGDPYFSTGRPDLLAEAFPRARKGDDLAVTVSPQLADGGIPGAAFAAEVKLNKGFEPGWIDVAFDASGVAYAYGGDYGDRLTLVVLPECALTTPDVPECLVGVQLETRHEADGMLRAYVPASALSVLDVEGRMSAPKLIDLGAGSVMRGLLSTSGLPMASSTLGGSIIAAVSGADSSSGTFKATDLAPRGTWGVTEPAGGFTYAIPITTPPVSAGGAPDVSLAYNSQATDGKTSASNNQAGVIGEGWSMPTSYIERLYKPCADDGGTTPEMCWDSPYTNVADTAAYVMSLQGNVEELVFDSRTPQFETFKAVSDPTLKVTRYWAGRPGNGDDSGEYFKAETQDGSVYYFGYNPSDVAGTSGTANSIAWEPVRSNNTGEPGFAGSNVVVANQMYRAYLDMTVDASSNASTYFYKQDANKYTTGTSTYAYVRDTQLARVEYGQTFDVATGRVTAPEAKVDFNLVKRCVEAGQFKDSLASGVDPNTLCAEPTVATAASYPDVPVDLICTGTSCGPLQNAPTYFSTVRLNQINTFARDAANAWVPVETTQLISAFPTTTDGSARTMWLDSVYSRGWGDAGTADDVDTYLTKFTGARLNNRVDWDRTPVAGGTATRAMDRMRISNVWTDLGGRIDVTYAQSGVPASLTGALSTQVCPQNGMDGSDWAAWTSAHPATAVNSSANNQLCFAVKRGTGTELYHNYVVTKVDQKDLVAAQPTQSTTYTYGGSPAYATAESVLYATGSTGDNSTFSSYRGFLTVSSWLGSGTESTKTTNQYFRGTGGTVTSLHDSSSRVDTDTRLGGSLESSKTVSGAGVTVSTSKATYTVTGLSTPAWDRAGITAEHNPHVVQQTGAESKAYEGSWTQTSTSTTVFDAATYQPTQSTSTVSDNASTPSKTQCSVTDYAKSSAPYLVVPVASRSFDGTCAGGILTSRSEVGYDGGTPGSTTQTPSRGLVTEERSYYNASDFTAAKADYDGRGLVLHAWMPNDVAGKTPLATWSWDASKAEWATNIAPSVTWAYGTDGAAWTTTVTRALGATAKTWTERGHGNTVKTQGATATDWTHYKYDGLGLMTAGWAPAQWGQSTTPSLATNIPSVLYRYDIYANGPTLRSTPAVVTTAAFVGDNGTTFPTTTLAGSQRRSFTFLDGLGRTIEQQSVAPDGSAGRTVTATRYNTLGQVDWFTAPFFAADAATVLTGGGLTKLVNAALITIPAATMFGYDTLGRTTSSTSVVNGVPLVVAGTQVRSTNSYNGLASSVTAPDGGKTTTTSDLLGRVVSKTIAPDTAHPGAAQPTTYAYATLAAAGKVGFQQVTVTDVEGKATVFESNLAGQRTAMVDPNAGLTTYMYDANGQSTSVTSPAGTITMGYDVLGRLTSRTTGGSSSATWDYVEPGETGAATDLGLLRSSTSITHTSLGDLTTVSSVAYDALHRPVSSTVTLPSSPASAPDLLGDVSGQSFTTTAGYDAIGQASTVGLPAVGGLPAETLTTGFRTSGVAQTLTVSSAGLSTPVVTGVSMSGTGQMLQRSYGNGLTRDYTWDPVTRSLTGLSASFPTSESGSLQTAFVQKDAFTRDVMGRIVQSTTEVPVSDGSTANGQAMAECFTYDGFNRLSSAWTVAGAATPTCGSAAPADALASGWDASTTAYAATWAYSTGGRITSLVKGAGATATTSTYAYTDAAHPAAATSVTTGPGTDSFTYDGAGRTVSRTVAGVTTNLSWDVTSSLTETNGQGGRVVYAYDTSGQRVLQARNADANGVGTVSAYVASGQVDDPNTASTSTGDLTATRFYTFAGSTVAVRTNDNKLSLMLGDEQGSTNVMMPVATTTGGGMVAASLADASASTRTAYTPYGELRGADNLAVDRGWLGQTEDRIEGTGASSTGTGLTYLNARYYDPVLSRFLSPDPLMNPGDPRTLDPYMYADNNPVVFTDASGLQAIGQYDHADTRVVAKKWDFSPPSVVKAYGRYLWGVLRATTPIPQSVDGIKMDIKFFKDPSGTWNSQMKSNKQSWNDTTGAYKSAFGVVTGKVSWSDHWHTVTHSPMLGYVGVDWDNRNLGGMSERAGVVTGVTIQMVVPGAAAAGATKGVVGVEAVVSSGLPDATIIVRGGESAVPPPGQVFSGAFGATVEEAGAGLPYGQIRVTTAGEIRMGGGTVEVAPELTRSGVLNEQHVNICLGPGGSCPFGPLGPNPVPKGLRVQ